MISGGFAEGAESSSARKAHLRSITSREVMEVQAVSKLPRLDTAITFSDSDLDGCQHPHDDPLVIRAVVANKTIHRVLVDNGSSACKTREIPISGKRQNRNFCYKIVISVKNMKFILWISDEETDFTVGIVSRNLVSTSNFVEFRDSRSWHVFRDIAIQVS